MYTDDVKVEIDIVVEKIGDTIDNQNSSLKNDLQTKVEGKTFALSDELLNEETTITDKERELLGDNFVLPTLEDEHITFQLGDQEGPLDVLLEMIKSTKLDIMEVRLADLTEQFINYMEALKDINMEQQSEFIVIAAMLLEIKSRNLLPVEEDEEETEEENPEELLKRRLQMYKLFKEASIELGACENLEHFYKAPDKSANDYRIVLKDMNMQGLIDAFSKLLLVVEKRDIEKSNERQLKKDRFTVAESIANMKNALAEKKTIRFREFFKSDFTKSEIINTFLAMLELLKAQYVSVVQNGMFGDIDITLKEGGTNEEREEPITEYNWVDIVFGGERRCNKRHFGEVGAFGWWSKSCNWRIEKHKVGRQWY